MTRKISLITAVAVAVVAVGAPAAFGEGRLADSQEPSAAITNAMAEDGFDRAVAASLALAMAEDGFDRAVAAKLALQSSPQSMFRRIFDPDLFRVDAVSASAPVSAPDSSPQIAWLQIGIGVGIGIWLALGLWLAVRLTRGRSLAHG